ncbi:hypothetical protein GONAM_16_00210 [Gordonia namibiensis NBRC 108229]|uniref:Uncharacterized protein n=1 Tax=Gordonia namibiensis NBRC 108229 TaxID=1208314 RepID=K6X373_9ACTN|nr:hypothetical protein GONAM_16_00210 [Gordonia namibiensis NBRC 108229]
MAVSAGVDPRDRVFALVGRLDESLVVGMVKMAPGPTVYRRRGGVWVQDRALLATLRARSRRRPLLRELTRRDLISSEVARWDAEETRRAAAKSGMYGEVAARPAVPSRAAVTNARRVARAARGDDPAAREDALLAELLDERRRSAEVMGAPVMASAARPTGDRQREVTAARLRELRASRERMGALVAAVRAGGR